jgi:hypothetical protein
MQQDENNNSMIHHLLNSMPMDIYDGRSPIEMEYLINDPFCENSPMILQKTYNKEVLNHVPFFCLVKKLLVTINEVKALKMTSHGNLSTKLVKELVKMDFIHEPWLLEKEEKMIKEFDSIAVSTARIIAELAGLTKLKSNELTLSKKAKQILDNEDDITLFHEIFKTYTLRFDWSYNDYFGENEVGQLGFAFTLDLLDKYGSISRDLNFYAEKYCQGLIEAFLEQEATGVKVIDIYFNDCYIERTFGQFLRWFGLIFVTNENIQIETDCKVEKSYIFNSLLKFD